jgi:hypothetical protein
MYMIDIHIIVFNIQEEMDGIIQHGNYTQRFVD